MIYIDPPFNTGMTQTRRTLRTVSDHDGDRTGFGGRRYRTEQVLASSYADTFDDYVAFLRPRISEARRLLNETGTLYVHLDYREAHYCKVLLDDLFGRDCFLTRSSGLTTMALGRSAAGRPSTTRFWSTSAIRTATTSTANAWIVNRTWPRGWLRPRRQRAGSFQRMSGGTQSCQQTVGRRPDTRRKSPRASSAEWSSLLPVPATGAWTSSPDPARLAL